MMQSLSSWPYSGIALYGAGVVACFAAMGFAARHARTAPASFWTSIAATVGWAIWGFVCAWWIGIKGEHADVVPGAIYALVAVFALAVPVFVAAACADGPAPIPAPAFDGGDVDAHVARLVELLAAADAETARTAASLEAERDMRRRDGLAARIADAFVTTRAETESETALGTAAGIRAGLADVVPKRTTARTDALIAADPTAGPRWTALEAEAVPLKAAYDRDTAIDAAAVETINALDSALSAISSARSWEYVDLASKNKGVSAASSMQTAAANSAVSTANQWLAHLKGLIGAAHSPVRGPGGTLDMVMDMSGFDGFDFTSFMALGSLSRSRDACTAARTEVAAFRVHSQRARDAAWRILCAKRAEIDALRAPFRAAAVAELPLAARPFASPAEPTTGDA